MDPFSTGANLAAAVIKWGYRLIIVFSDMESSHQAVVSKGSHLPSTLILQHDSHAADRDAAIESTLEKLRSQTSPVLAILAGAENGVELAETLAYKFHTRNNGHRLLKARSNKILAQEHLANSGLANIKVKHCNSEEVRFYYNNIACIHASIVLFVFAFAFLFVAFYIRTICVIV